MSNFSLFNLISVLCFSLILAKQSSWAAPTPPIAAQTNKSTPESQQISALESTPRMIRIDFPVAWQITRMRTNSSNPSMITETYREVWTLEQTPNNNLHYLRSPRARVRVYVNSVDEQVARLPLDWPNVLMFHPTEFARLLGLDDFANQDAGQDANDGGFITIALTGRGRVISEALLRLADEQSFEIQVEIGNL